MTHRTVPARLAVAAAVWAVGYLLGVAGVGRDLGGEAWGSWVAILVGAIAAVAAMFVSMAMGKKIIIALLIAIELAQLGFQVAAVTVPDKYYVLFAAFLFTPAAVLMIGYLLLLPFRRHRRIDRLFIAAACVEVAYFAFQALSLA